LIYTPRQGKPLVAMHAAYSKDRSKGKSKGERGCTSETKNHDLATTGLKTTHPGQYARFRGKKG